MLSDFTLSVVIELIMLSVVMLNAVAQHRVTDHSGLLCHRDRIIDTESLGKINISTILLHLHSTVKYE
jgi:hypothetical protein